MLILITSRIQEFLVELLTTPGCDQFQQFSEISGLDGVLRCPDVLVGK